MTQDEQLHALWAAKAQTLWGLGEVAQNLPHGYPT